MVPRQRTSSANLPASIQDDSSQTTNVNKPLVDKNEGNCKPTRDPVDSASEVARRNHDYFNLIALIPVIVGVVMTWDLPKLFSGTAYPQDCFLPEHFMFCWGTTFAYFLVDLWWVASIPICVKSPDVIIKHHIIALIYLCTPLLFFDYAWFMPSVLSVEINTWFLIMRRVIFKAEAPPAVQQFVSAMFYFTWIAIRVGIYPAVMYEFLRLSYVEIVLTGQLFHWPMLAIPVHAMLCVLNLKWTYDLFSPMVRSWISPTKSGSATISSGL